MSAAVQPGCYPQAGLPSVEATLALLGRCIAAPATTERVALHQAVGRVLASPAHALVVSPAYDRSAMDGFAFRFETTGGMPLTCVGRARAGAPFAGAVETGECVAIATGAMLPAGCDTVVMREQCTITGDHVVISGPVAQGQNIRRQGEDFMAGTVLLPASTRLGPRHIGLLASAGCGGVDVYSRLRVAVLSIGDELGAPVFDANRPLLLAYAAQLGADTHDLGILPDRRDEIAATLARVAAAHDVILCSAATSKGDEDHLRAAMGDCGGEILLAGVAIKPGKPVSFGRIGNCLLIGLPGNPAAALITFLAMGVPLLRQAAGELVRPAPPLLVRAGFAHRKKPGLREYLRVTLTPGADGVAVAPRCAKDGAAMLASLAESDGLVWLDEDATEIMPGALLPFCSFGGFLE